MAQLSGIFGHKSQIHVQTVASHTLFNGLAEGYLAVGRICFVFRVVVGAFVFVSTTEQSLDRLLARDVLLRGVRFLIVGYGRCSALLAV